ncbi:putative ubiquitin-protein ligase E3 component [Talaromyces proteolyticus]|uniref:E3 ubiquitin-protein ligase n=1 Tax=Talaromyces proteolyticus TaxID=1131652 RepID=A0AAD4L1S2_9EURO|nr:putative ubiquitin-protein ligase E3 component [Talaromyces proteolyticus]KAH8705569.1 putative ubiquitin-protein ligase E3 component [Talaromyces proteolyticus]
MLTECERMFGEGLLRLPVKHNFRYGPKAEEELLQLLFRSLSGYDSQRLKLLFPDGAPEDRPWKLAEAQGAREGAEYSEAARGKRCGHIFRAGEGTYRCITCAADDTCVLCSRCFDASDHAGHQYQISLSSGNCGCCDCGDEEAWRLPLCCAIHTESGDSKGKQRAKPELPATWVEDIRVTVSRSLDYFCDVISCSPEQLRLQKSEEGIRHDEEASRLHPGWYGKGDEPEDEPEFALALWNDEKHTIRDVSHQVMRACRERASFGEAKAHETNDVGRSVVKYSKDLNRLLQVSRTIEHIKVTVTVRSARDTFRELMCGTIIEWLADIAGCSFGEDSEILRQVVCEELLRPWRRGSGAYNADIGMQGIDDHERQDLSAPYRAITLTLSPQGGAFVGSEDDDEDVDDNEDGQDRNEEEAMEGDDEEEDDDDDYEEMEIDLERLRQEVGNNEGEDDVDMGNMEDELEAATATFGRYPPPPPPPPPPPARQAGTPVSDVDMGEMTPHHETTHVKIPKTPTNSVKPTAAKTPIHWQTRPARPQGDVPAYEDLTERTRLDWMVLFDLRLWKKARTDLRDLYISTVVNVPQFKRIMGLRLSALYTALAQLYLIADREPDHSIVNLSLQLLTTPSITEEIVHRGNFLTKVMAILYTFLTTRQVGEPWEVNPTATLAFDAGSVTNRRLYHFFLDLRYLLQSEFVQNRIRSDEQYLLQFLDLVKLPQGICPNVRAVGEHVEYETDTWISASILMREINRLCRQFCDAFRHPGHGQGENLVRAIKTAAISAIAHSSGVERKRFDQAEIKEHVCFKQLPLFDFENYDVTPEGQLQRHRVVDFVVEKGSVSFHHALHYTLSWLLECGRGMSSELMRDLLLDAARTANERYVHDRHLSNEDLLLTMFDYPLRVCSWLAQMKAGMWVRNGLSLRHQMSQYRGVSSRDFAYYRDIFLLQTAFVTCDPSRVLATIAERFGVVAWIIGDYQARPGYEDYQIVDVAEEFVHLLIILITDRTSLTADDDDAMTARENISRDIAHVLCFKPLSFSDLSTRLSDKLLETDMFQDVLEDVATFRPPEGLNDTGTFELKPDYIDMVDPFSAHYNKNQRDEAESIYRNWMAKKTGKEASDIVFEPKLRPIPDGAFLNLSAFTKTPLFAEIIHRCLDYTICFKDKTPQIPLTRVETFLHIVLHLTLVATLEDNSKENDHPVESFISNALSKSRMTQDVGVLTIVGLLEKISVAKEYESCSAKIKHIIKIMWQKQPRSYASATQSLNFPYERLDTNSPARNIESEQEIKKKQALDRQARVMAQFQQQQQNFLNSQSAIDWGEEDFSDTDSETLGEAETKTWKYPSGTCILCQEETNDSRLFGTFALVQDSSILRLTDIYEKDWIREVLRNPSSLDRSAESIRPFGVAGENKVMVKKLDSSGGEVITEKIGLSKGFSSKNTLRGPVTTGCGHIMHYACFEVYCTATQRRHSQQVARNHPEHLDLKEFVCPLCKALGNAFLPIVWKGKEETYPGVLNTQHTFDQFIHEDLRTTLSQSPNYPLVTTEFDKVQSPAYRDLFTDYLTKSLVTPLSSKIDQLTISIPPPAPTSSFWPLPTPRVLMPGIFPSTEEVTNNSPLQPPPPPAETPVAELVQIYRRLKKTLRENHVQSQFPYSQEVSNGEDLIYTDSLIRSFGFSISALEIAQRGVESDPGATLLDKIPQLTLTHLRVLAETAYAYTAVGGVSNPSPKNRATQEFQEMHRQKICQLFVGHPVINGTALLDDVRNIEPLLGMDVFVFLAECSLSLLPVLNIEVGHLVQLCYVAEILKVSVTFILWNHALKDELARGEDDIDTNSSRAQYAATRHFFDAVVSELKSNSIGRAAGSSIMSGYLKEGEDSSTPTLVMALRRLISSYALPFLRKTVILLHVQHGVDFPSAGLGDENMTELDRLTEVLRLPTLDEIFDSFSPAKANDNPWYRVVSGWIFHWNASRSGIRLEDHRLWPSLSHPAIFELIGLPKYYDLLIEEANRRRCPNSKKELSDPSICLFCGDIFCSQAVCCIDNGFGGCNQHVLKCGKNIGLFINIRKCTVLYLHNHNGSWHFAPYLDRHGEVDPGLRRNRQLILNQKRYDKLLRDVWLSHSIPATISRKLEADINNGGWETI